MSSDAALGNGRVGGTSQHHLALDATQAEGDQVSSPMEEKLQVILEETAADPEGKGFGAEETMTSQYPSGVRFWLLMFNLGAVIVLGALDMSIVATAGTLADVYHGRSNEELANSTKCLELQITFTPLLMLVGILSPFVSHSALSNSCNHLPPQKTAIYPLTTLKIRESLQALPNQTRLPHRQPLFLRRLSPLRHSSFIYHAGDRQGRCRDRYSWS